MRALLLLLLLLVSWSRTGAADAAPVGLTILHVPDGTRPPVSVGLWFPSAGAPAPIPIGLVIQRLVHDGPVVGHGLALVAMAHGQGGDFAAQSDLAYALAEAGFVVAAPTFNGDNPADGSRALDVAGRVRQFEAAIAGVLAFLPAGTVDPARIGAFGFSSGGTTALIAAGGNPNPATVAPHCRAHPAFYDCRLIARFRDPTAPSPPLGPIARPARIRALVLAAPALGFAFDRAALASVTMPVQLWEAANDTILPAPFYAEPVRDALPTPPDFHLVPGADHQDFLAPCAPSLAFACADPTGFNRPHFHDQFNNAVVDFFRAGLGAPPPAGFQGRSP